MDKQNGTKTAIFEIVKQLAQKNKELRDENENLKSMLEEMGIEL